MILAVALFGLFVAVLGVAGMLSPKRLLAIVTRAQSRLGPRVLALFRLLMGALLLGAAQASRAPLYLGALGVLSLVSGALTPLFGRSRFEAMLDWWRARPAWQVRLWSGFVLLFGLSLVLAVFPPPPGATR